MTWKPVAATEEVGVGEAYVVEIEGKRVALCRTEEGIYAIDDLCTHDGGPLDQGELFGNEIECPRHGARFDVRTGRVTRLPAVRPVKSYPAREEDGQIEVELP